MNSFPGIQEKINIYTVTVIAVPQTYNSLCLNVMSFAYMYNDFLPRRDRSYDFDPFAKELSFSPAAAKAWIATSHRVKMLDLS